MDGRGRNELQAPVARHGRPSSTPLPMQIASVAGRDSEAEQPQRRVLRLHIPKGSFVTCSRAVDDTASIATGGLGQGAPTMDAKVWGKLPEELMWEVVVRLPAAKLFQLHSVSREWRRVLTSANFRNRIAARESEEPQPPVVACVQMMRDCLGDREDERLEDERLQVMKDRGANSSSSSSSRVNSKKVVDIDLTWFVPAWFWSDREVQGSHFSVVAAAGGLVCISNNNELQHCEDHAEFCNDYREDWMVNKLDEGEHWKPWGNRYCVLNPVTRTCTVLPDLPFLPLVWRLPPHPTAAAAVVTAYAYDFSMRTGELRVATYDLATGGGGGGGEWTLTTHKSALTPLQVLCAGAGAGDSQWGHDARARLLEAAAAGAVDRPSVAELGLDASAFHPCSHDDPYPNSKPPLLVAHGGAVFFVATPWPVVPHTPARNRPDAVVCCVWRLGAVCDGYRYRWEPVARLLVRDMERLTGPGFLSWPDPEKSSINIWVANAYRVRESLFCQVEVREWVRWMLLVAVNLRTGDWELVNVQPTRTSWLKRDPEHNKNAKALELRPDLFLSGPAGRV